jgi:hypothetical protein
MKHTSGSTDDRTYGRKAAAGLTLAAAVARLIPHPANFTPVGSASLFAGARLRGRTAYLVPLVLMALTDPILSALYGYPLLRPEMPAIYGSLLINVWIGRRLLSIVNARRVAAAAALCSLQFFVLTNFGLWLLGNWYPHTPAGLAACFTAALPFLGRTMAGDLAYAALLFGFDALAQRFRNAARQEAVSGDTAA